MKEEMKNPVSDEKKINWNRRNISERVFRGGSWYYNPKYVSVSVRWNNPPSNRDDLIGFRIVRNKQ